MRHLRKFPGFAFAFALLMVGSGAAAEESDEPKRRATVLATFTGGQITVADMEDALAKQMPMRRAEVATPEGRVRFLREMVTYRVLWLEAERRGFASHDAVHRAMYNAAIDRWILAQHPVRLEDVTAAELTAAYNADSDRYQRRAERRASHILLERESEARALLAELKGEKNRSQFARLARERSRDARTRDRGGDLGSFDAEGRSVPQGTQLVPPEVAKAVFAVKRMGDVVPNPVPVEGGFSVVLWTAESPGFHQPLKQVEGELREKIAATRQNAAIDAAVRELERELKPETHPELIELIRLDPERPLDMPAGFPAAPPDPTAPPIIVEPDGI